MKLFRLILSVALVGLFVACSSSTAPPYPTPDDDGSNPPIPPNPGFVTYG